MVFPPGGSPKGDGFEGQDDYGEGSQVAPQPGGGFVVGGYLVGVLH